MCSSNTLGPEQLVCFVTIKQIRAEFKSYMSNLCYYSAMDNTLGTGDFIVQDIAPSDNIKNSIVNCFQDMIETRFLVLCITVAIKTVQEIQSLLLTDCFVVLKWWQVLFSIKMWRGNNIRFAMLWKAVWPDKLLLPCTAVKCHLDRIQKWILMFDKIHIHISKWSKRLLVMLAGIQASKEELGNHRTGSWDLTM